MAVDYVDTESKVQYILSQSDQLQDFSHKNVMFMAAEQAHS